MYLVTGASGNVGSQVLEQLLAVGKRVRVFTRAPEAFAGRPVEIALGDFRQPQTFSAALEGVDAVYLMNGRNSAEVIEALMKEARPRPGQRLVFQSTFFAGDPNSTIGRIHHRQEEAITSAGWSATFLRPTAFMSNVYQWMDTIEKEGVVYNPMGTGRYSPVAPADIAAVAVLALDHPADPGESYQLTGPDTVSVPEQVAILAEVWGRPIRCVDLPVAEAVEGMRKRGVPPLIAEAVGESYNAVRNGRAVLATDTVQRLTGRPATTFREWSEQTLDALRTAQGR